MKTVEGFGNWQCCWIWKICRILTATNIPHYWLLHLIYTCICENCSKQILFLHHITSECSDKSHSESNFRCLNTWIICQIIPPACKTTRSMTWMWLLQSPHSVHGRDFFTGNFIIFLEITEDYKIQFNDNISAERITPCRFLAQLHQLNLNL